MSLKIKQAFLTNNTLGISNSDAVVTVCQFILAGVKICEFGLKKYTNNFGGHQSDANKIWRCCTKCEKEVSVLPFNE